MPKTRPNREFANLIIVIETVNILRPRAWLGLDLKNTCHILGKFKKHGGAQHILGAAIIKEHIKRVQNNVEINNN